MKDIHGYEGLYAVTEDGRVWCYPKTCIYLNRTTKGKYMSPYTGGQYTKIGLMKNDVLKCVSVHRLVASAFIPNPENKSCVNHKNGNKHDNRVENLEWCTYGENAIHKFRVLKVKHPRERKIGKFKDGILLTIYTNMTSASTQNGVTLSDLSVCANCKRGRSSAGGFNWKFL